MRFTMRMLLILSLVLLPFVQSHAQSPGVANLIPPGVISEPPTKPNSKTRYLFYLHGRIVEDGRRAVHPEHGAYEYDLILTAFTKRGFVVISEQRPENTEVEKYAEKVVGQVKQLLDNKVPPDHITVVGASQGSMIAMLASTYIKNRDLNFVLIGSCAADPAFLNMVDLHGNMLSIWERSDLPTQCQKYRDDATGIGRFKEVELNTGLRHGYLYKPLAEWIEPAVSWALGEKNPVAGQSLSVELMRLQRQADTAESKKDFAALNLLLSDNYIFTAPTGLVINKTQLFEELRSDQDESGQNLIYDDVRVLDYGKVAIVNYLLIIEGSDKERKPYVNKYRYTTSWVKEKNSWQMASVHVSRIKT